MRAPASTLRPLLCGLGAVLLVSAAACSFTTATGFSECQTSKDCPSDRVCSPEHYCVSVACTESYGATDAGNAITFGAAIPFTDSSGNKDNSERADFNAALLAFEEMNQRGIGNRPLALWVCDTQGQNATLDSELKYLIDQKKVAAVLTSGSAQTIEALKTTVPAQVLVMTATSTAAELSATEASAPGPDGGTVRLLWRTAPSDAIQGQVIAETIDSAGAAYTADAGDPYLANVTKVGILYVDDPYGQGLSQVVSTALVGKTVTSFPYPRGGDAGSALNELEQFDPDLTVAIGFPDDFVKILNQANGLPNLSTTRWFFTDAAKDPALLSGLTNPKQLDDALGSTPAQGAGPAFQSFSSRFETRFGTDPLDYSFTSHSYDAMYLLGLGAAWAVGQGPDYTGQVTGPRIGEGLTRVSGTSTPILLEPDQFVPASTQLQSGQEINVQGASGELDFDPTTGEAPSPIQLWRVADGGFETVTTVSAP